MGVRRLSLATCLGFVGLVACGAATEPLTFGGDDASTGPESGDASSVVDSGTPLFDSAPALDAPPDTGVDTSTPEEAGPPCDGDADYDAALCMPPSADQLIADPPTITVSSGSYGVAQFKAIGPWASDPNLWISFLGGTIPLEFSPFVLQNAPPTAFVFQVAPTTSDQQYTFTALGRDGNIERSAAVTVNVTGCQPWDPVTACAGFTCGAQPDNCGGLVSCGICSGAAPYCLLGSCVATPPDYCPRGEGITPSGCVECNQTSFCNQYCRDQRCSGLQDICFCSPFVYPNCPISEPDDGSPCQNIGQTCDYFNRCVATAVATCEPSGLWSSTPYGPCTQDGGQ